MLIDGRQAIADVSLRDSLAQMKPYDSYSDQPIFNVDDSNMSK